MGGVFIATGRIFEAIECRSTQEGSDAGQQKVFLGLDRQLIAFSKARSVADGGPGGNRARDAGIRKKGPERKEAIVTALS